MANTPKKSGTATVTKSNRGDLAARRKAELDAEHAAEKTAAAEHMSLATASAQHEADTTVGNYTDEPVSAEEAAAVGATQEEIMDPTAPPTPPSVDDDGLEIAGDAVDDTPPPVTEMVRPREDCRFTMGVGTDFHFLAGRAYKVKFEVAQHMREKGLLWD